MVDEIRDGLRMVEADVALIKRAAVGQREIVASKLKIPEPKSFGGTRSAKELENFLWDMEQYFKAARVPDSEKVTITSMYLVNDAKLWWRTKEADGANAGRPAIESWEVLKKELKEQFLPSNTSYIARDSLKKLKQTGSVRDYVKEFSSLMLDIKNMSEDDKLFNFTSGLQTWAQAELRRQGAKDLSSAITVAESLVDFKVSTNQNNDKKNGRKEPKWKNKDGGKPKKKGMEASSYKNKPEGQTSRDGNTRTLGCFICGGPHRMRDCPKKEKLAAMVAADGETEVDVPTRVNPLQLLSAIQAEKIPILEQKGLMYVEVAINGRQVMAMVDTGATHNFVAEREIGNLGLNVQKSTNRIKAVNSQAKPILGLTEVDLRVGEWQGKCNLMAVPLDDFNVILGMDFLRMAKVLVLPYLGGMLIGDEHQPSFVTAVYSNSTKEGE